MTQKRRDIGIIASVAAEAEIIKGMLAGNNGGRLPFSAGRLNRKNIVLAISGMGKTNAAHAAAVLALKHKPSIIINMGIGGAYPSSDLKIGDIAIAEKEIYGDEGVILEDGFHETELIGIPLLTKGRKRYFNEFPLDSRLVSKAFKSVLPITHHPASGGPAVVGPSPITVRKGPFLTLSTCTGTNKRAAELEKRYGAICENMEGAAIAHVCSIHDIPFMEVRGISNIVGKRDLRKWNIELAAANCQKAVLQFLGSEVAE
jgi:futalosine hydrolase